MFVEVAQILVGADAGVDESCHTDTDNQGVLEEEATPDHKQYGYQDSGRNRPQDDLAHC